MTGARKTGARDLANDFDEYAAGFPPAVRKRLLAMRRTIRKALPEATETISYGVPTFRGRRNIVHFAAFANHLGLYPAPRADAAFRDELAGYAGGKGTVQFPHDAPLPLDLVARIARHLGRRDAAAPAPRATVRKRSAKARPRPRGRSARPGS